MEINASGFSAKELAPHRGNVDQELTQRAQEKDDAIQQTRRPLEPRPVEQPGADKLRRIDIYV
ncbi:hypothetical protein [Desulfopila inferna]|uniref:hypothetical protein n=1 Tax=Desulfopila inferna TaxID=468528 RepID=UPI001962391F|nr:hypothetical protein [Desulfopila inferna]MBM9605816.1 hypothetical protein [Desulfopila inferna]